MHALRRHQLACLRASAWREIVARAWDPVARACLDHWAERGLPLVVTRQAATREEGIALGISAPLAWGRRRIALRVKSDGIDRFAEFPLAREAHPHLPATARAVLERALTRLDALDARARVYGSHGWQIVTSLPCVHAASDIDLWIGVDDAAHADAVAQVLTAAAADEREPRLDGEVVFRDGSAVAWREWAAWRTGGMRGQVLVKRIDGAALEDEHALPDGKKPPLPHAKPKASPSGAGGGEGGCQPSARGAVQGLVRAIGDAATLALRDELALAPKPGLVSFADSGSHRDMDAHTFMRSLFALRASFRAFVSLGAREADFAALEREGIAAEARMLAATAGVNTHRGAIFTLGLLCASAGRLIAQGRALDATALQRTLLERWGDALAARAQRTSSSNGSRAATRHGLRSAGAEAALGFPVLFDVALPALRRAIAHGLDARAARLDALFAAMAVLDDTNVVHRGGIDALRDVRRAAAQFIAAGGAARAGAIEHAQSLHRAFVTRNLSPGGSADVVAAACWVQRITRPFDVAQDRHEKR